MTFGERLQALREEKGLTQPALAKELGLTQSSISKFEHGIKEPARGTLVAFAKYFSVSTDYLLGLTDK
ncbi:MAG: helix-turn-helix domain-containing protein [Roseburia sp.]|nr:helix-turn-helix domain-containing protein [Roseburia sp.]